MSCTELSLHNVIVMTLVMTFVAVVCDQIEWRRHWLERTWTTGPLERRAVDVHDTVHGIRCTHYRMHPEHCAGVLTL